MLKINVNVKINEKAVEIGDDISSKLQKLLNDYYDEKNTAEFEQFAKFLGYKPKSPTLVRDIALLRDLIIDLQKAVCDAKFQEFVDSRNSKNQKRGIKNE